MPSNKSDPLITKEKKNILNFISRNIKRNISAISKIIYSYGGKFGNILICLNKIIFFCEIIGCKEIILNNKAFWFLKRPIKLEETNITIKTQNFDRHNNLKIIKELNSGIILFNSFNVFFYFYKIKPNIRIILLRDEIINNLPKFNISKKDLYIHLRSGDIYKKNAHGKYSQPPLCFYSNILNNFNFGNIYLISNDNNNPIINRLTKKYNNIIYTKNSLEYDLSHLMNSYNLVGSISSFLNIIILLNYNLENLWEYNIYQVTQRLRQIRYDLFQFPNNFTIYRMEASINYKNKMYNWKNSKSQRKLMMKEKCINSFMILFYGH